MLCNSFLRRYLEIYSRSIKVIVVKQTKKPLMEESRNENRKCKQLSVLHKRSCFVSICHIYCTIYNRCRICCMIRTALTLILPLHKNWSMNSEISENLHFLFIFFFQRCWPSEGMKVIDAIHPKKNSCKNNVISKSFPFFLKCWIYRAKTSANAPSAPPLEQRLHSHCSRSGTVYDIHLHNF